MVWTRFFDMHSGGGTKEEPYENIYIEAPENEAIIIFYNRFGHNPQRVTCTCCGDDYSIYEEPTLMQATAFERGAENSDQDVPSASVYSSHGHVTLDEYVTHPNVLVIRAEDIKPDERIGTVPVQGYVWRD